MKKLVALTLAVITALTTVAVETVAKFSPFETSAKSLGYAVSAHESGGGFCVTGGKSWSVNEGVTIILKYKGLPSTGDQALVTLKRSDNNQESRLGVVARAGQLVGYFNNQVWTTQTGTGPDTNGTLVVSYRANTGDVGFTVWNAEGTELYRANRLVESGTYTIGEHFDFGDVAAGTCAQEGFAIEAVEILKGAVSSDDVPALVANFEKTGATEAFSAVMGSSCSGWFTEWSGENGGAPKQIVTANGVEAKRVVFNDSTGKWHPYRSANVFPVKDAYVMSVYGTADMIACPAENKYAVLWAFGETSKCNALAKDHEGNIVFIHSEGNTVSKKLTAGPVSGYHLFTVVFDKEKGCGLYIDDKAGVYDPDFTALPIAGWQVGSVYRGLGGPYVRGDGFVPLNIWASEEAFIPMVDQLAKTYPAVTTVSQSIRLPEGVNVLVPALTLSGVISGSGELTAAPGFGNTVTFGAANTFTGGLTVKSGTAVTTTATGFGPNNWGNLSDLALITVEADATLDLGNTKDTCYRIISQGGTITNSGAEIGTGSRQTVELALWDDSTVSGHTFGLLGPSYAETSLDMGKGVLTIDMASADEKFILCNTTIMDEGTFRLNCGRLYLKKTIKGTLNIDLPEQPEIGTSVCTLDSEVDLAKATINVTVNGGALTADRAVDPLGRIVAVDPDSIVVKDSAAMTWTADTTEGAYTFSELEIAELKVKGVTVTLKSENEANGATIDFGSFNGPQKAHYVIESGTHTIKWFNESQKTNFDTNGRDVSPSILVKSGATLNLYAKDLTGWNNSANSTKGNVIKVEAGATLNLHKNGNNTWYYQGRLIIEPGATVHADDFESGKVRLNGGAGSDYQQLYVPASTGAETTAVYSAANGFRMASNATQGYAAFVGKDSVLEMQGNLATDGAYDFAKYGAGALKITGTVAANIRFVLGDGSLVVKGTTNVTLSDGDARVLSSETGADGYTTYTIRESAFDPTTDKLATTAVLRISEIMPKPSDKPGEITTQAGYDANGLESGWVELENTSATEWANLADYKFIRVNRSKANSKGDYGNFPEVMIPPSTRYVFYTSERYANSADMTVSAWTTPDADGVHPKKYGVELHSMLVWPDKINPKKFPFTRLIYAPGGVETKIVDTVVIPSDIPEGYSIIVEDAVEGQATTRWMTAAPTKGGVNATADLVRLGPNAGPLYEIAKGEKHDSASEFAVPTAPARPGEDYVVTFALNPVMSPTVPAEFRAEDAIRNITMIVRKDLDNASRTNIVVDLTTKTTDAKDWGDKYTVKIPADYFPAAGHLLQWKFEVTDASGNVFTTPSFNNKDDGYEWYGTIVKPTDDQMSANLATWHMFVDAASKGQMDVDADKQTLKNNARVAIYDSSTSNYYDYVRIDLRGNTSASFNKKSHGLRFAKTHPLTMKDCVAGGEVKEIRKSSLIGEPADPSRMRQMMSFWLWKKMGNHVPFDFPVRCNLNGEFFQLGFHSERFTDELIEDVYGLDKFGYGYKNVGTLASGSGTTAGGIEKKTPDDGNESDVSVLESELRSRMKALGVEGGVENNAALTQFVVEKFDLAAWLNYLASARITQEMDDVWANISAYYDNAEMKEGARGTGTWMPLGYDFNLSLGQWYYNDVKGERIGLMANQDWFKSHPFYGGLKIRANGTGNWNRGIEAVLQSAKFRRLYLRRLRTLMDQELKEPGTAKEEIPLMAKMREIADLMRDDAALDCAKYPWSTSINNIDVWGKDKFPKTMDAGIEEIWTDYIQPRRTHFYVTHSVTNDVKTIGYGRDFNAGIPLAQSSLEVLKEGFAAEAVEGGVVIRNANAETIDLSGWDVSGPVVMKLPAGTVIDQAIGGTAGELFVVTDRRAYVEANNESLTDQVIIGNATVGSGSDIGLTAADGTVILSADVILPPGTYRNLSYDVPVRLAPAGSFAFEGVSFNGGLNLGAGSFTLKNQGGFTNSASVVEAPEANITFTGKGAFELKGEKTSGTLMTVNDLIVSNGVFTVESKAQTEGTEAVHLNGGFAVEDKGSVNLKLTKNAASGRGFFIANKDKFCRFAGNAVFAAELNGPNCQAIHGEKGSVDLVIKDNAKVTATGSAANARYFKMAGNIKISGGTISLTATGAGTELLSCDKSVTVEDGVLTLTAKDDCISATRAINVSGGTIVGTSTANDVLDSNGTITISGGTLVLLAPVNGHEGLDCDPSEPDTIAHTITISGGVVYSLGGAESDLHLPEADGQAYATLETEDAAGYVAVESIVDGVKTRHLFVKPAGGRKVLVSVPGLTGTAAALAELPEGATEAATGYWTLPVSADPAIWEEVEVTETTPFTELVPAAQAEVLAKLNASPVKLAEWAKVYCAKTETGTDLDLAAFALACAPGQAEEKRKDFKVTITIDAAGNVLINPTIELNVDPVYKGSTDLKTWHDRTETDRFFKAEINLAP